MEMNLFSKEVPMTVDLSKFCAPSGFFRKDVTRPFSDALWTYATDGSIAVRVARIDTITALGPDAESVFSGLRFSDLHPATIPHLRPLRRLDADVVCPECNGQCGLRDKACIECVGTGILWTAGEIDPDDLSWAGIGAAMFNPDYIIKISGLPDLRIPAEPRPDEAMPFSFTGGVGALMPLRYGEAHDCVGRVVIEIGENDE